MRQRGESAAPRRRDRDGREGGEEKLAEKRRRRRRRYKRLHRHSACHTDHQVSGHSILSLSLCEIKGPLPAFYLIISRAVRRRTAGLRFKLTAGKIQVKSFHARSCRLKFNRRSPEREFEVGILGKMKWSTRGKTSDFRFGIIALFSSTNI